MEVNRPVGRGRGRAIIKDLQASVDKSRNSANAGVNRTQSEGVRKTMDERNNNVPVMETNLA